MPVHGAAKPANPPADAWPALPYAEWKGTCATLQLWTQVVGKIRLAQTPWLNHSWHVTLRVTPRGLVTPSIPYGTRSFSLAFDFIAHRLRIETSDGEVRDVALAPRTVQSFHAEVLDALAGLEMPVTIFDMPCEIPQSLPFSSDRVHDSYDRDAVQRFLRVLQQSHRVLGHFRTGFVGKSSPVQFFWGSFDLAVTRFSGRRAPLHAGSAPHMPRAVMREAYSHEVSSAGFWPGGGDVDYPAYYSYAYPEPQGFRTAAIEPAQARYDAALGEFLLPYDAVRTSANPDATLLAFLDTTYAAAADAGRWDRAALEGPRGEPGVPRPVD
jgi:hypothetical protein